MHALLRTFILKLEIHRNRWIYILTCMEVKNNKMLFNKGLIYIVSLISNSVIILLVIVNIGKALDGTKPSA